MYFVISFMKLGRFWWNLVYSFLNKCAVKLCKRFHLIWIMYLHYLTLWNLKCSSRRCYHWVVRERNCRIYSTLTVASKFAKFQSSWQSIWGILQEKVLKRVSWINLYNIGCRNNTNATRFYRVSEKKNSICVGETVNKREAGRRQLVMFQEAIL